MTRYIHFIDNWDLEDGLEWEDIYLNEKQESPVGTAKHRLKFAIMEDAFNEAWTIHIMFGRCLTIDESQCTGWYHGLIQIGPGPKPLRTGATIHSMCVMHGPL